MLRNRKSSPQEERMFHVLLPVPHIGVFKENSCGVLTVFLDFFLTNGNRERGVRECYIWQD